MNNQPQQLTALNINGEKVLITSFFGANREPKIQEIQKRVFDHFNIPINHVYAPFEIGISYGQIINRYVNSLLNQIDYFLFFDCDAFILKKDGIERIINILKTKDTLWGISQQSTHILKGKSKVPNHAYAGFSTCGFSKELYIKLGCPTFEETYRGDIGEELTYRCEELGYNVCLSYPTEFNELTDEEMQNTGNARHGWVNEIKIGLGSVFNNTYFHSFHTSLDLKTGKLAIPRALEIIEKKANQAMGQEPWLRKVLDDAKKAKENWPDWAKDKKERKLELITGCVNTEKIKYSKYLEITLPLNKSQFDNILIVTTENDLETQRVCKENGVDYFCTDKFFENGSKFDNNRAVSAALHKLKYKDWVCSTSPDMVYPDTFRKDLRLEELQESTMYGTSRTFINTYQDWLDFKEGKKLLTDFEIIPGYGCGFCQIFNLNSQKLNGIPLEETLPSNGIALESDIWFLRRFHPNVEDCGKLPITLIHLGHKDFGGVSRDSGKEIIGFFGEK